MPYKLIIFLSIVSVITSGCTTQKVLGAAHGRDRDNMYVDHFIKGVFTKDNLVALCLNGKSDIWYSENQNNIGTYKEGENVIDNDDFMVTYNLNIDMGGKKVTHKTNFSLIVTKLYDDCDEMPSGKEINFKKDLFTHKSDYRRDLKKQLEYVISNYNNEIIITDNTIDGLSYGLLFISLDDGLPINYRSLQTYYYSDNNCYICYAGLPFTLAIDIITFPFQILWVLTGGM